MSDDELDTIFSEDIDKNVPVKDSTQFYAEQNTEEPTELELAQIKIQQLEDALKKTKQFKPATQLQEKDEINTIAFRCGIDGFKEAVSHNMVQAKSRGWKTVEITMRAV